MLVWSTHRRAADPIRALHLLGPEAAERNIVSLLHVDDAETLGQRHSA
jgi:hypothetical protein